MTKERKRLIGLLGYDVLTRPLKDIDGYDTQVVFNGTHISYLDLVNENEIWNICLNLKNSRGDAVYTEHRSVFCNVRGDKKIFTIFRFPGGPFESNSFGRELAELIGIYYNEKILFEKDIIQVQGYEGLRGYIPCFTPNTGYSCSPYYYKGYDEKSYCLIPVDELDNGKNCPFYNEIIRSYNINNLGNCQRCHFKMHNQIATVKDKETLCIRCNVSPLKK